MLNRSFSIALIYLFASPSYAGMDIATAITLNFRGEVSLEHLDTSSISVADKKPLAEVESRATQLLTSLNDKVYTRQCFTVHDCLETLCSQECLCYAREFVKTASPFRQRILLLRKVSGMLEVNGNVYTNNYHAVVVLEINQHLFVLDPIATGKTAPTPLFEWIQHIDDPTDVRFNLE